MPKRKRALQLFVSAGGDDAWSGLKPVPTRRGDDGPFATLQRARQAVRQLKAARGLTPGGVTVFLRGGLYFLDASFELSAEDSGSGGAPVVYRPYRGEEVRLIGGRRVEGFTPVTDPAVLGRLPEEARGQVLQLDLRALGITDYGSFQPRGHGAGSSVAALELFYNGRPMTVARWPKRAPLPNLGFESIAAVRGDRLVYAGDRPRRWASYNDVYLHGYFALDWASSIVRVAALDPDAREIVTDPPVCGHYAMRAGGRFFFFNVLDELGEPSEYYVDRRRGMLYFWPPEPLQGSEAIVSMLECPLIRLHEAEHVRIERLTLECMRGDAVQISGGRRCAVAGCVLRNVGRDAVRIEGGCEHLVTSCDIYQTGECGVYAEGGDRKTLTPSGHCVRNCHIHHVAREGWTYFPAIFLRGCGARAAHNRIHDHRHSLIFYPGNDHLIEFNELYNATLEGDDSGCLMIGRDFTYQGHRVRYNYIHHSGGSGRSDWGTLGVFLDDCAGGTDIYGNVFYCVDKAVMAGGGINTRIRNNVFVACSPAVWFDERGAAARVDHGETMVHGWMRERFYEMNAHCPPFSERYCFMDAVREALQNGTGVLARGGCVVRNIVVGSQGSWLQTHWAVFPDYFECRDNLVDAGPQFVQPALGVFQLRDGSPARTPMDFKCIPFERIGLVRDRYRKAIEDVRAGLEIVRPVGPRGGPGCARLVLHNVGDVPVEGVELVEFKRQRHGPGFAHVEVPYRVAAGERAAVEFDVTVPGDALGGLQDVYVFTRGERIRPAWAVMPVSYSLEASLELLEPAVAGRLPRPARARLTVRNVAPQSVSEDVQLRAEPEGAAAFPRGDSVPCALVPGEQMSAELELALDPAFPDLVSRLTVLAAGRAVKPARLVVTVEYPLSVLPPLDGPETVAAALAAEPVYPVKTPRTHSRPCHAADLRLAVAGEDLALAATVKDEHVMVTEMLWDGSCIEVFGSSSDRERIGQVFGNLQIGQVFLVPAHGGEPAKGYFQARNAQHFTPDIRVRTDPLEGGYALQALVPLRLLEASPESGRFLFEVQVTTGLDAQGRQERVTLFGTQAAYRDTAWYAMGTFRT